MKLAQMWSAQGRKKVNIVAALAGVSAVAAGWSAGQPWAAVSLAGNATCPVTPTAETIAVSTSTGIVEMPNVAMCSTLWTETASQVANSGPSFGIASMVPTVPLTMGIPSVVFWAFVGALMLALGVYFKNALLAAPAILNAVWGYTAVGRSVSAMTSGLTPEQAVLQYGATVAGYAVLVLGACAAVATVYIAVTNRNLRRARAKAEGRDTWTLDSVRDLNAAILRSVTDRAATGREESKEVAK